MPIALTERRVLEIWQGSLQGRTDLKTIENEPVRIVYPGRRNDDRGADFKDAIIATGGGQLKGDIEIHVKASYWWTHRHHQDSAYNRVILHVVYQNDTVKTLVLENGFKVPTLALRDYIENNDSVSVPPPIPCRGAGYHGNAQLIASRLDVAGEARFLVRVALFKESIAQSGAGQALYQGIMTALGYSKNKAAMAELATRMPLESLEAIAPDQIPDSEYLVQCQSRLISMAGLLPSQREAWQLTNNFIEDWEAILENKWAGWDIPAHMSAKDWHFFKVRPGNQPVRRIAAMSYLLLRYRHKGLLAGLEDRLKDIGAAKEIHSLEEALLVPPDSYWSRYLDFCIPAYGIVPALLGQERAADIIVNVLLPFAYARGLKEQHEKTLTIYRDCRAPAENSLVKHMRQQLGISRFLVSTARRQQGLIHIYKTFCLEGVCSECPLSNIPD
ncbi:MAG: DUF2851 family protein [Dehalococcoidales bacterium]